MDYVFEITDKTGRKIHLTKERWEHISIKHPNIATQLEEIEYTLTQPTLIVPHKFEENMRNYYKYYKYKKYYLLVSVKYLNGEGYVATAFITRKIIKR